MKIIWIDTDKNGEPLIFFGIKSDKLGAWGIGNSWLGWSLIGALIWLVVAL